MESGEERVSVGEEDAIDRVTRASVKLLDTTPNPVVHRGQHPKMSGLVRAEFIVSPDLPETLRVGLFGEARSYPAWIRFSNGLQKDDRKPDAHGMAIKLMGVEGEKVLESQKDATTHDFVLVDNPIFFIRNPIEYAQFSEVLLKVKGKAPSMLRRLLFFLPGPLRDLAMLVLLYFLPGRLGELSMLLAFGRKKPASPLGSRYWSATPYQFGPARAVKYSVEPSEPDGSGNSGGSANYLRQAMVDHLEAREASFSFRVQLQLDPVTMPIEDPTVQWDEASSPFVEVARIRIPVQKFDTPEQDSFGENLSFTPWHALPAHRPLGGINRTRRQVYEMLSKLRHDLNGVHRVEPSPGDLPEARRDSQPLTFAEVLEAELRLIDVRRRGVDGPVPEVEAAAEDVATPPAGFNDDDGRMMRARVLALDKQVTGLSFSGGGIRAATLSVGFLQGLSSFGLIRRFDYLSTVSGGGYAGSWLAAWLKREGDVTSVEDQLCGSRVTEADADRMFLRSTATGPRPVVDEEPEPLRHLRAYSSYITPRPGLLTADTWTVIMIWLRNVSINMLMILPMVMLVVLGIRLASYGYRFSNYAIIEGQPAAIYLTPVLLLGGVACLFVAFWNNGVVIAGFRRDGTPRWPDDLPLQVRRWIVMPMMAASILLTMPIRFILWQLGNSLDASAGRLRGPSDAPARILMDFVAGNLGIFGWPNVLLHLGFFGTVQAIGAWIVAKRAGNSPRRSVEAAFLAGLATGLLALVIETMLRGFGAESRPDLMTVFGPPSVLGAVLVSIIVEVGLLGRAISEAEREWRARLSAYLAIAALLWLTVSSTVLYLPGIFLSAGVWTQTLLASGWVLSTAAGVLLGRSSPARPKVADGGGISRIASVAPPVFLLGLLGVVALFASWFLNMPGLGVPHDDAVTPFHYYLKGLVGTPFWRLLVAIVLSSICFQIGRRLIDVNLFSLNAMYANRLARCYLGASRLMPNWQRRWGSPRDPRVDSGAPSLSVDEGRAWPTVRDPNPATGFDPEDDIPLADLKIGREIPGQRTYWGPHLLINTTLNLVAGQDLAWRDRKGESFVLSPLYCGTKSLGYAELPATSGPNLTLGRAVSISGAAVDPNMSFYQSGVLPAFLTFFNARLGYWIENPSRRHWIAKGPKYGDLLSNELLGKTDGQGDFVHLSDGGHFENMGVYELVRRRCRYIVALDSGEDVGASDENLARLIRLCRIDFGVRIQLDTGPLQVAGDGGLSRSHVVVGRIRYDDVDQGEMPGVLVYVKASMTGDEPADVQEYARRHPDFPHEATDLRQSFGEDQFESYRALGSHIAAAVFAEPVALLKRVDLSRDPEYVPRLFSAVQARWTQPSGLDSRHLMWASDKSVELMRDLRSQPELSRICRELYPELPPSTEKAVPKQDRDRAELMTIVQALVVMQGVWEEIGSRRDSEMSSFRGTMNSFRRWASTTAFRRYWPVLRPQLAGEFVRYCEEVLHVVTPPPATLRLSRTSAPGSFEEDALAMLSEELRGEWPRVPGLFPAFQFRGLPELVRRARSLVPEEPTAWLIVMAPAGIDPLVDGPERVVCGIILALDYPEHPDPDLLVDDDGRSRFPVEFFVWVRRPYRSSGIGSQCVRRALATVRQELDESKTGRPCSIWARYPATDFYTDVERDTWLAFFARFDFRLKYSRTDPTWTILELR